MSEKGPKSTNPLRLLKNDKAHAHRDNNKAGIEPSKNSLTVPADLSERAKQIFKDFVSRAEQMYPMSDTDMDIVVLYSNNKEQLECYELYLRENGSTYESSTQYGSTTKPRPEVGMLKDCKTLQMQILKEFGLSPSSRTKIKLPPKKEEKKVNPFGALDKPKANQG